MNYTGFFLSLQNIRKESFLILQAGLVRAASLGFMIVSLTLIMYIVFTAYAATGGVLTPKKVFTTLSLLIVVRLTTIHFLIQNVLAMVEGRVATVRLQVIACVSLCIVVCTCTYVCMCMRVSGV